MYRSTRVFRGQYRLLLTTSLLERAEQRLHASPSEGSRRRRRRLLRETERLWDAVELQRRRLLEPEWWRLDADREPHRHVAPRELIDPRLGAYVNPEASVAGANDPHLSESALWSGIDQIVGGAAVLAMFATVLQIAVHGIHNGVGLIAAEAVVLVLAPIGIWFSAERARRRGR